VRLPPAGILSLPNLDGQAANPGRSERRRWPVSLHREDVLAGQEVLLKNGLMEYGSILRNDAYLGPDFTADYLDRAALKRTKRFSFTNATRKR